MSPACLAELSPDAPAPFRKEEESKAIVDRWFTSFWGKNSDPGIVDEFAASHIFFNYSLHLPRVGRMPLKTFMADLREGFPTSYVNERQISSLTVTRSWSAGCATARTRDAPFMISSWAPFPRLRAAR
jgi:hypothetical protein